MPNVEVLVKGHVTGCGEGPFWEAKTKTLLQTDLFAGDIHRIDIASKTDSKLHVGMRCGHFSSYFLIF